MATFRLVFAAKKTSVLEYRAREGFLNPAVVHQLKEPLFIESPVDASLLVRMENLLSRC